MQTKYIELLEREFRSLKEKHAEMACLILILVAIYLVLLTLNR